MPKRKKHVNDALSLPKAVLAYERCRTAFYESMSDCIDAYGISSCSILERLIERQQCWTDGYTTFDYAASPQEEKLAFTEFREIIKTKTAKTRPRGANQTYLSLASRRRYDKASGGVDG